MFKYKIMLNEKLTNLGSLFFLIQPREKDFLQQIPNYTAKTLEKVIY